MSARSREETRELDTVTDRASHVRKAGSQCANDKRGCSYGATDYFCPS